MRLYYDPIHGQVELDDLIFDLIQKCSELKRLKYIGMMNFKSVQMLPLTSISRLEHTIGLAYLAQKFSEANHLPSDLSKDLMIAALYHDINCGSFGHAVEWAIDRYTPYDHETKAEWISGSDMHQYFSNLPAFLEMPGLHKYDFGKKYKPNFKRIYEIISGLNTFVINNKGIDLDNIDNVFRMAFYMGISQDAKIPEILAKNLKIVSGNDNFIIDSDYLGLIHIWHALRKEVYHQFIYSREYMGFEFLIFRLIYEYSKLVDKDGIGNLFHLTDEQILWKFADKKKHPDLISDIAQKLLLQELPYACSIIRTSDIGQMENIYKENNIEILTDEIKNTLNEKKLVSESRPIDIFLHVTTDNRKTNRKVDIYVNEKGTIVKRSIGEDKKFILLSILSTVQLPESTIDIVTKRAIEILEISNLGKFERVPFSDDNVPSQVDLFKL